MKEFISFPTADRKINLADKIGVHYCGFGVLLLDDDDGDQVTSIEKELGRNASDINCRVFRLWLQGKGRKPVTWDTFIDVLKDVGLNALAMTVQENLIHLENLDLWQQTRMNCMLL